MRRVARMVLLLLVGCGSVPVEDEPDAAPAAAPREAAELVSGTSRLEGGRFVMEVQIGHGLDQRSMSGGNLTAAGGAAVLE